MVGKGENAGDSIFSFAFNVLKGICFQGRVKFVIGYLRLFIVATGCPSERYTQKTVSCYTGPRFNV